MSFRDQLPDGCPPNEAEEITWEREVFRLVRNDPPDEQDFLSQRQEQPDRAFRGVTECQTCGLSVFAVKDDAVAKALKLPNLKGRKVCRVKLSHGAGHIQQTFQPSHHTWWPLAAFDLLGNCEVEVA